MNLDSIQELLQKVVDKTLIWPLSVKKVEANLYQLGEEGNSGIPWSNYSFQMKVNGGKIIWAKALVGGDAWGFTVISEKKVDFENFKEVYLDLRKRFKDILDKGCSPEVTDDSGRHPWKYAEDTKFYESIIKDWHADDITWGLRKGNTNESKDTVKEAVRNILEGKDIRETLSS